MLAGMLMVPVTMLLTTGGSAQSDSGGGIVAGDEIVIEQRERIRYAWVVLAAGDEQFDRRAKTDLRTCGGIGGDDAAGWNDAAGRGADCTRDQTRASESRARCRLRKSDDVGNRGSDGLAIEAADAAETDGLQRNRWRKIHRVVAENSPNPSDSQWSAARSRSSRNS